MVHIIRIGTNSAKRLKGSIFYGSVHCVQSIFFCPIFRHYSVVLPGTYAFGRHAEAPAPQTGDKGLF